MLKKIFFGMSALALLAACTDDYTDWAQPQANSAVPAVTANLTLTAAQSATIALDDVASETVKLFNATLPEGVTADSYNVKLTAEGANYADYNITADASGNVATADLQKATTEMFTVEAIERTFNAIVSTDATVKGTEGTAAVHLVADTIIVTVKPLTPEFGPYIYFIGATDGWNSSDQKLACPKGDGLYTGFCYVADPNSWGIEFKFQRVAGSWDDEINAGLFTTMTGVTGTNNIAVAEEGVYYFEVNLAKATISATKVDQMGIIGDFNSWGGDEVMTWNATDYCYEVTGSAITANGWKFRVNADWAINLGGKTLDDLEAGGDNLTTVGTTVKLYPTRRDSDKIYCTVE